MTIYLDDRPIRAYSGESVAAALMAGGVQAFRKSRLGEPRGPYCGIGNCFECVLTVDGRPNVRTCNLPARDGMNLRTDNNWAEAFGRGTALTYRPGRAGLPRREGLSLSVVGNHRVSTGSDYTSAWIA